MRNNTIMMFNNSFVQHITDKPRELNGLIVKTITGLNYQLGINEITLANEVVATLQKPKSEYEESVFVLKDGELVEMNIHMSHTKELMESDPEKFQMFLEVLENTYKSFFGSDNKTILHSSEDLQTTSIPADTLGLIPPAASTEEKLGKQPLVEKVPTKKAVTPKATRTNKRK